ncbi:unnamed protein product [Brassica rapa subsp. trilocularis]
MSLAMLLLDSKTHVQTVHSLLIDVPLTMSFFDRQAVKFHKQLEAIRGGDPRVVVATGINPKFEGDPTVTNLDEQLWHKEFIDIYIPQ